MAGFVQKLIGALTARSADAPVNSPEKRSAAADAGAAVRAGDHDAAIRLYRVALEQTPGDPGLLTQLGNMLKDSGDPAGALRVYGQVLRDRPHDADLWLQTGHALKLSGDLPAAQEAYERAILIDPENTGARAELEAAGRGRHHAHILSALAEGRAPDRSFAFAGRLERLEAEIAALRGALDDILAQGNAPPTRYDLFAERFPVPPPPMSAERGGKLHFVASGTDPALLHARIAAAQASTAPEWRLWAEGPEEDLERYAVADARIALGGAVEAEQVAEAGDWIVHLGDARPAPLLGAWLLWAGAETDAAAFVFDEIIEHEDAADEVLLRAAPDPDAFAARPTSPPHARRAGAAEGAFADLVAAGAVAHIPLPLIRRGVNVPEPLAETYPAPATVSGITAVTVIIPTRDNAEMAETFIGSMERCAAEADRVNWLIIDNGAETESARTALERVSGIARCKVIADASPFNWSLLNNGAAAEADPDAALLFANDDMLMLSEGWDDRLLAQLARPEIGIVGARLLYPNETIQHAGIRLGWRGGSIHEGLGARRDDPGPDARWITPRRAAAVTGAFLATRAALFAELGGFDAARMPVSHSDVDFCLKARSSGLGVLYDPAIELFHFESVSRGLDAEDPTKQARFDAEKRALEEKWGDVALAEPGLNPFWADYHAPYAFLRPPTAGAIEDHIRTSSRVWRP